MRQFFKQYAGSLGVVFEVVARDSLERGIHMVPLFETHRGHECVGALQFWLPLQKKYQLIAIRKRQGFEENGVNGGKDRAVCANAEGQRENDGQRKGG